MNRYAIIENGRVANTVVADEPMADNWVQSDTAGIGWDYDGENFTPPVPELVYTVTEATITADGQALTPYAGSYYCEPGATIQLQGNITDANGDTVTSITMPVTLKMPLVRHANGQPTTDEIYLNVTLQNGVMTASGKIEMSGDWKILISRNNEALHRIGAQWKLSGDDVTFLA